MQHLRRAGRLALSALSLGLLLAASATSLAARAPAGKGSADEVHAAADAKKRDAKDAKRRDAKDAKRRDAKDAKKDARDRKREGERTKRADSGEKKEKAPMSIGAPNRGRLVGSVRLKGSKHLTVREGARSWGLPALTRALERAAARVAKKHPRSVLLVGDMSARKGGHIEGHNSHQTGRDADVGFYAVNSKGKPVPLKRFVAFNGEGKAAGLEWLRFDDERNWALVEALLADKDAQVRYLFVSMGLRGRLLAYAAKKKVPQDRITRAAAALMSPSDVDVHDDHFHVRIACPESMRGTCVEESAAREGGEAADTASGDAVPAQPADRGGEGAAAPRDAPAAREGGEAPAAAPVAR
ncbi:MAG: penicillin-insensitive murein endopeptidase [Polyangiaceae bacterium]|nr:penicillin-insensitive murein endopeptidase [Polyangiaceae bacterium]